MRSQSLTASIPLHIMSYFSLAAFKIFSFSLAFSSLTTMSVSVDGFVFILHRIHQVSWICGVMLIFKIGAFFIIISSNLFSPSADFSFLFFWDSYYMYIGILDVVQISKVLIFNSVFFFCILHIV